jgi:hypothetical protein
MFCGECCYTCTIPRWLAEIAYDQDLNVHHKSYKNLGNEDWDDLEPLCRRCHEIEKFGRSDLRAPKTAECTRCGDTHWNPYSDICVVCDTIAKRCCQCCVCKQHALPALDEDALPNICQSCHDLKMGNLASVWFSSENSLWRYPESKVSDAILCAVYARLGTDEILDSLIRIKPSAYHFKKTHENLERQRIATAEGDIPFDNPPF